METLRKMALSRHGKLKVVYQQPVSIEVVEKVKMVPRQNPECIAPTKDTVATDFFKLVRKIYKYQGQAQALKYGMCVALVVSLAILLQVSKVLL